MFAAVWARQEQTKTYANNGFVRVPVGVNAVKDTFQECSLHIL